MKKTLPLVIFLCIVCPSYSQAPTVDEIKETSAKQSRDLSIPESRIVINPFDFNQPKEHTPSEYSNHPNLPLNTGYLTTEKVGYRRVNNILNLYSYQPSGFEGESKTIWQADLTRLNIWETQSQTNLEITALGLKFSLEANPNPLWKYLSNQQPASVDFDKNPFVVLSIPEFAGDNWSLKMKDENGTEKVVRQDAPGIGVFEYSLAEVSGWSGTKNIRFYLYCIGKNSSITINEWEIVEASEEAAKESSAYSTAWMPNELPFEAQYDDGSSLSGTDFFYDINTIVRRVKLSGSANGHQFLLAGAYSGQNVTFENNVLIQNKGVYKIAVSANVFEKFPVKFYNSLHQMKAQSGGQNQPSVSGYWAVLIDASQEDDVIASVAYSYSHDGENANVLPARAKIPLTETKANEGYQARKAYWNNYLETIPHPSVFGIEVSDDKGVTADNIKLCYYKAWTFVASCLLMGDPEKFPYPQVVTGKASLWDEGHDLAPYTATWESFFGIQFLAFTDTENAWKSFEGIMSLVDETGMIGGESLPSRKAQTAWLLYEMTGDKDRLLGVYEPLSRYLHWRLQYPHWIYHSQPDINQKDAEFVFSVVVDLMFMSKIAKVVKGDAVASDWKKKAGDFYEECLPWFWTSPTSPPVQYYNTATHERSAGGRYWVTTGLFMEQLSGSYLQSMNVLFSMGFSDTNNFGGSSMGAPKFPDVSYTAYGLIDKGYVAKAEKVMDACIRDIVRSGNWFSEQYEVSGEPYPTGVRPSLFGASMMIDFVMMKNGFRYGNGTPMVLHAFEGARSITDIHFGNDVINISRNASGDIAIDGSYAGIGYTQPSQRGDSYTILKKDETAIKNPEQCQPFVVIGDNEQTYIRFNEAIEGNVSLKIFDVSGRIMQSSPFQTISPATQVSVRNLKSGLYLIVMETSNKRYVQKQLFSKL